MIYLDEEDIYEQDGNRYLKIGDDYCLIIDDSNIDEYKESEH